MLNPVSDVMNQMLADGKIQTYGIAEDFSRLWITLLAHNEYEVWEVLTEVPIESVTEPLVTALHTYNQSIDLLFPAVSLN